MVAVGERQMRRRKRAGVCAITVGGWRGVPPGVNPGAPARDSFCRNISQLPSRDANLVTTQTWGVTQRYIYSPYGSLIVLNADFSTPPSGTQPISDYLYQGMTLDAVTGLYYARNRNYSPSLGVWVSQDPAVYINGANTYQFVESGPVGAVDPSGTTGQPPQLPFGSRIHKIIGDDYALANLVLSGAETWLNRSLGRIIKEAKGNPSKLFPSQLRKRPDILNMQSRDLYEIKSAKTGAARAVSTAKRYVSLLHQACVVAALGPPGALGTSGVVVEGTAAVQWNSPVSGAIIYSVSTLKPVPVRKPAPAPYPSPVPWWMPLPSPGPSPEGSPSPYPVPEPFPLPEPIPVPVIE